MRTTGTTRTRATCMIRWTPSEALGPRRRWLKLAGAFLAPIAILIAALSFPPTGDWIRSLNSEPLHGRDVAAQGWQGSFSLLDAQGRRRTLADFAGRVLLVDFGYTHCPDACPTTLSRAARVRQLLGRDADKVQVVFITIDPKRDGAQMLADYVAQFDPSIVALRGTEAETNAAAQAFHAEYHIIPHGQEVLVEHTVDTYLVDPNGQVRAVLPFDLSAEDVARDVQAALREAGLCWPWPLSRRS